MNKDKKIATRDSYGKALLELGKDTKDVVVLDADLAGATKDVMNTAPLDKKFEAFGCDVIKVNGHDFEELEKGFERFHANKGKEKPTVILMKTVKGKGVSFMENEAGWHGKAANDEQTEQALQELEDLRQELGGKTA